MRGRASLAASGARSVDHLRSRHAGADVTFIVGHILGGEERPLKALTFASSEPSDRYDRSGRQTEARETPSRRSILFDVQERDIPLTSGLACPRWTSGSLPNPRSQDP